MTAAAADAFNRVRREKLIWVSSFIVLAKHLKDPAPPGHQPSKDGPVAAFWQGRNRYPAFKRFGVRSSGVELFANLTCIVPNLIQAIEISMY
jgi:hypothetical protein